MSARHDIIEAFWQFYAQKPIDKITVTELMRRAGYHRSLFYTYFTDIYAIREAEEADILHAIRHAVPQILKTALERRDMSAIIKMFYTTLHDFLPNVVILLGPNGDLSFQAHVRHVLRQTLYQLLHITSGEHQRKLAVEFFINGHIAAILYFYEHQDDIDIVQYAQWLQAILTPLLKPTQS